jgi:hypothetical protein
MKPKPYKSHVAAYEASRRVHQNPRVIAVGKEQYYGYAGETITDEGVRHTWYVGRHNKYLKACEVMS